MNAQQPTGDVERELAVTDALLDDAYTVIDLIPDCPAHGGRCIPHARRWVREERHTMTADEFDRLYAQRARYTLLGVVIGFPTGLTLAACLWGPWR